MYSEIDELARQLEYCILIRKVRAAEEVVKRLCMLKANLKISIRTVHQCSSHLKYFSVEFRSKDISKFECFQACSHIVCKDCLRDYITKTYNDYKADFPYYCPGCVVSMSDTPTKLDYKESYFQRVVSKDTFERSKEELKKYEDDMDSLRIKGLEKTCSGLFDECQKNNDLCVIPECYHLYCFKCLKKYFFNQVTRALKLKCPREGCEILVNHNFIEQFYDPEIPEEFFILNQLRLEKIIYLDCPKCRKKQKLEKSGDIIKCTNPECEDEICVFCGKKRHAELYCEEVVYNNYNHFQLDNYNCKLYRCLPDSPFKLLKRHYFIAASLLHWNIEEVKIKNNEELAPAMKEIFKYNLNEVYYIRNPALEYKFNNAREELKKKLGRVPEEKYLFHGSKDDILTLIAREGFKIGGITVSKVHGSRYGIGVYTAEDPVTSIFYSQASNTVMIVKVLIGNPSPKIMTDEGMLSETKDHYYLVENDNVQIGSKYYIFFNSEHLLPLYSIKLK